MEERSKHFYVGSIRNETEKAYNIDGVWYPKSQINIVCHEGYLIEFSAPKWIFDSKNIVPHSKELADSSYSILKRQKEGMVSLSSASACDFVVPCPKDKEYYPFQRAGISYIERTGGKCLLSSPMGTGKTPMAIGWLNMHPEASPVIIVSPASVKFNWEDELSAWLMNKRVVVNIENGIDEFASGDIYIVSYDLLYRLTEPKEIPSPASKKFMEISPQAVIFDECHKIKDRKSLRFQGAKEILKKNKDTKIIAMTGTPFLNRPIEIWNILQILRKDKFSNWKNFVERYCAGVKTHWGWKVDGASNTEELGKVLREVCMFRPSKEEVLKELPPKRRVIVRLNRGGKISAEKQLKLNLDVLANFTEESIEGISEVEKLRQEALQSKISDAIDFIENALEQDKVIVFAHHKVAIERLKKEFPDSAVLVGETPIPDRKAEVDRFQNDKNCKLFIGSLHAASEGINLTASATVIFLELGWTPGVMNQAEDRSSRIGQTRPVTVYYLVQDGSIEVHMAKILQEKQKVLESVLNKDTKISSSNIFYDLISSINETK